MTKISKVLVVFTTAACLAFLGFAAAVSVGGPNWERIAAEELPEYDFDRSIGENPTWSAKLRTSDESVGSDPKLAAVVVKALEHKKRRVDSGLNGDPTVNRPALDEQIQVTKARLKEAQELAEKDAAALKKYEEQLVQQLQQLNQAIAQVSQEIVKRTQQAEAVQAETDERRGDVVRLQEQLETLQEDRDRIVAQQEQLRDRIQRLKGTKDRLERRKEQLQQRAEPETRTARAANKTF